MKESNYKSYNMFDTLINDTDHRNMNNHVWKKREYIYCNNCGKYGHVYKKCYEPIMSYGIICLNLHGYDKIINFFISKYRFPDMTQQLKNICVNKYIQKNISCNNKKDLDLYEKRVSNEIDCIIVRRKLSFNYIHLIRGLYGLEIEDIIKSINLVTFDEYNKLLTKEFDELWVEIWGDYECKQDFNYEYEKAKERFIFLREYIIPQIKHKINIAFMNPEWGFPKGRRFGCETNLECAIREFNEETGLSINDYTILDRLFPLIENVKGTNNLNYKHIYYIALLKSDFDTNKIKLGSNINQNFEIGNIGAYNMEKINELLREYNTERKNIINILKLFFMYNIRYFELFYREK